AQAVAPAPAEQAAAAPKPAETPGGRGTQARPASRGPDRRADRAAAGGARACDPADPGNAEGAGAGVT
ncbi:hypothetical protein, partial [Bradyrhizobium sp. NAS96.2]|uniref:hypothetical protein n=1 Tax=Bradyrhizobium sp. NAS96.2 TaxID=1680160 RepID=UPI001AECDF7A